MKQAPALTKEERSQRAKQRIQERREEQERAEQKYPPAHLMCDGRSGDGFFQIWLEPQSPLELKIRVRGKGWFSSERGFPDIQVAYIGLDNPMQLACLIRGLVARYNSLIEDINREVEATPSIEIAKSFPVFPQERAVATLDACPQV